MPAIESPPARASRRRAAARAFGVAAWLAIGAGSGPAAAAPDGVSSGVRVVEGDILVAAVRRRGVGTVARTRRWSNGEVPYLIDPTLEPRVVRAIEEAAALWNEVSGVTLFPVAPGDALPTDHLHFQSGPGCASWVGRQGGRQAVWVGTSCTSGSVMHEIGHALGLEHEHTRSDRDRHVRVLWDRIVAEKRHNFALAPAGTDVLGEYDVGSIMHYGPSNFSIDGRPTLEALEPAAGVTMGQREAPSAGDVDAVARLYASDLSLSIGVDDALAASEVTLFVTNQHAQGAHAVSVALAASGGPIALAGVGGDEGWRCETAGGEVTCRLARLVGNAASRVVLDLRAPVDAATLDASLSSKTPDLDPDNNLGRAAGEPSPVLGAAFRDVAPAPDDAASVREDSTLAAGAGPLAAFALCVVGAVRRRRGRPMPR